MPIPIAISRAREFDDDRRDAFRRNRRAPRTLRRISASRSREWARARPARSRLAAITSGGAIPDNALYTVVAEPEGTVVGTVDEDFAVESLRGDIMLLGNTSWRIRRVQSGRVLVEDAHGAAPNVPFWRGEAPARTAELSAQVAELRRQIDERTRDVAAGCPGRRIFQPRSAALAWLKEECGLDDAGAEQAVEYIVAGRAVLGAVPTQQTDYRRALLR